MSLGSIPVSWINDGGDISFELIGSETMSKHLNSVDREDRYVVPITRKQIGVGLDIDLLERIQLNAASRAHGFLHFFAKTAAGLGIKNNSDSRFHLISPSGRCRFPASGFGIVNYPLANTIAK